LPNVGRSRSADKQAGSVSPAEYGANSRGAADTFARHPSYALREESMIKIFRLS